MNTKTTGLVVAALALVTLIGAMTFFTTDTGGTPVAQTATALASIDAGSFATQTRGRTVIDVRTPEEYEAGHLPDAKNMDFYNTAEFAAALEALDKTAPYAIYCRSGNRSGQTLERMRALGFTDVVDLKGGIVAWQNSGKALCSEC